MMIKTLFRYMLVLFTVIGGNAQVSMDSSFSVLLKDKIFETSDVSMMVYDLTADSLVFSHRANKLVRPASVMKLLTSVVALEQLGEDYLFKTQLYKGVGNDSMNYYVKGVMDPLFDEEDIVRIAATLSCGTVIDTLFADCSFCDSLYWGPGWSWDDNPYGYQPYLSPLMLCGGAVEIVVKPVGRGKAPVYSCTPSSSFYTIINEAECGNPELGKLSIMRDWLEDSNVIRITGNCTAQKKERMNMYKSADFFMAVLAEKLDSIGVKVNNIAFGKTPQQCDVVATVSTPIADVLDEALMESDNLCAESLVYHLSAANGASPAALKHGCSIIDKFVKNRLGVVCDYSIADGSGLSLYNYLSADILLKVLRYAYGNGTVYTSLYSHLPLSGVSGTLKYRTKSGSAYKKVRAKTGTVKGVCSLAGYARSSNGNMLAFVMLNGGMQSARPVREWQDKACEIMCR